MSDESRWGRLAHMVRDLDPGSRALLDLSVRRGLGDVEIAGVLGTDPRYVSDTRNGVIRSMAADLRLGDELTELERALAQLPPDAWLPPPPGANGTNGGGAPEAAVEEEPAVEDEAAAEEPEPEAPEADEPDTADAQVDVVETGEEAEAEAETEPAAKSEEQRDHLSVVPDRSADDVAVRAEAAREAAEADRGGDGEEPRERFAVEPPRRRNLGAVITAGAIVLLGATLVVVFALSGGPDDEDSSAPPADEPAAERERPAGERGEGGERGGGGERGERGGPGEQPAPERTELTPVAGLAEGARGTVARQGDEILVRVRGLPRGTYEVWLYDTLIDSTSLGRLRPGKGGVLRGRFAAGDLEARRWLDISREPRNGNANHSGRSVLRVATEDVP